MTDIKRTSPLVLNDDIPLEAIEAAKSYVNGYIDSGYEDDFFVLRSCLISVSRHGESQYGSILNVEYAYFSIGTNDVLAHKFKEYSFQSETIRLYQEELIEAAPSGRLSAYPNAGELTAIDLGPAQNFDRINAFKSSVSDEDLFDRVFQAITWSPQLYERIFSFADITEQEDARSFLAAAEVTLTEIKSQNFDLESEDAWWVEAFDLSESDLPMFERILERRLEHVRRKIIEIEKRIELEKTFSLAGCDLCVTIGGNEERVDCGIFPACIVEIRNGRGGSKLGYGSALHIVSEMKKRGAILSTITGKFAGKIRKDIFLVSRIDRKEAENLIAATALKIGIWIVSQGSVEVINYNDYYSFDAVRYS